MVGFLLLGLWASFGALTCTIVAARKGLDDVFWLFLGAVLGPLGLLILARAPGSGPDSYIVFDPRNPQLPKLVECRACRRTVPLAAECTLCGEPLSQGPRHKRPWWRRRPRASNGRLSRRV